MAKGRDKNFVSIWFWLLSTLVMVIPIVNVIMILVWAFYGDNESRKNYFKSILVIFFLSVFLVIALASLGLIPAYANAIQKLLK